MHSSFSWTGRKALVTGAAGFLGAHLCRQLVAAGAEVHGTTRRRAPSGATNIAWRQVELARAEEVQRLVAEVQPDVLFHMAGFARASRAFESVLPALHDDLMATVNVLVAATELHCGRVVVTGSLEEPLGDGANLVPSSPYAAAKWSCTAFARMFHELYRTPVVIGRPFMTYGPGQRPQKVVPYIVQCLLDNQAPLLASGHRLADWVYVDDVIEGLMALGASTGLDGQTIDFGSGTLLSISAVAERIIALMESPLRPNCGVLPVPAREVIRAADADATAALLDWRATTSLDAGLAAYIASCRAAASLSAAPASNTSSLFPHSISDPTRRSTQTFAEEA